MALSKHSEVSALLGRAAVAELARQLLESGLLADDLPPVPSEDIQRLLLAPGDVLLPPGAGPPAVPVLHQQVAGPHLSGGRVRLGRGGGGVPLGLLGELVEVVDLACKII